MKRFTITTLGCKVNQCESAAICHLLDKTGYQEAAQGRAANVVIINTCTVTGKAAMQSRQAVRQARRKHPEARIVVTGCYAQTASQEIEEIEGVDLVVGHDDKLDIPNLLDKLRDNNPTPTLIREVGKRQNQFASMAAVANTHRTRAFLKIQDGCNTCCTYCIVPRARGRSRSMPVSDVLSHLAQLGRQNLHEVVLTGIHLGAFGLDLEPPTTLADLLHLIALRPPVDRIRLSSIEPTEVEARILQLMADPLGHLCHHLHIPLQSGDNQILKRMGRPYTREIFRDVIEQIHQLIPDAAIGVDVLAGFPGETDAAFNNTTALITESPITYLHVFPFSPRPGTPAAGYQGKVPERIVKARCQQLRQLGEKKRSAFANSMVGRELNVLIETKKDPRTGSPKGLSDNYLPVILPDAALNENTLITARIDSIGADHTAMGTVVCVHK